MCGWQSLLDRFFRCEAPPNQRYFGCVLCDLCWLLIFVPFHFPSKKITIQDFSFYNFQAFQLQIKSIQKIISKRMTIIRKNACCFSWWASGSNWWFFSNVMCPSTLIHTHCCWRKFCTTWDVSTPVNNRINYQHQLVQAFLPSTVLIPALQWLNQTLQLLTLPETNSKIPCIFLVPLIGGIGDI